MTEVGNWKLIGALPNPGSWLLVLDGDTVLAVSPGRIGGGGVFIVTKDGLVEVKSDRIQNAILEKLRTDGMRNEEAAQ